MCQDIHPSERVAIDVCDADDLCVTPGQRRKVNVYFDRGEPVLQLREVEAHLFRTLDRQEGLFLEAPCPPIPEEVFPVSHVEQRRRIPVPRLTVQTA